MPSAALSNHRQTLILHGDLSSASLEPWITRHSARLGLKSTQVFAAPTRMEIDVQGHPDLIDALEVGCLLGPIDVWVASVERVPTKPKR